MQASYKNKLPKQFLLSVLAIAITTTLCKLALPYTGYRITAFILLTLVSVLAMVFEIYPVIVSALSTALIWNFFFIPPIGTFHIDNYEDTMLFLMYFLIALVHAVLTSKLKNMQKIAIDKEEKEKTILLYNTLINSLAHELKTPISTLLISVESLKSENPKISPIQKDEILNEMEIAAIRLNNQIENILNMSRLESGFLKLKMDWCDLNELIFSIIRKTEISNNTHSIDYQVNDKLPLILIDSGLMGIALQNILNNSIQHTKPGTAITIGTEVQSNICKISISDNGHGIQYEDIDQIFDRFYKGQSGKSTGTGLGLSIAKGYVEAHGGSIKVNNIKTGGVKFSIQFPTQTSYINQLKNA